MPSLTLHSPFGPITLQETAGLITRLSWEVRQDDRSDLLGNAAEQLVEYFAGRRQSFDLPLAFGEGFQEKVRRAMFAIPFGQTRTYGELAKEIGVPAQTIGQACGANPIPILIPCHRILGRTGLGGFSAKGGVETKVALLRLEGAAGLLI